MRIFLKYFDFVRILETFSNEVKLQSDSGIQRFGTFSKNDRYFSGGMHGIRFVEYGYFFLKNAHVCTCVRLLSSFLILETWWGCGECVIIHSNTYGEPVQNVLGKRSHDVVIIASRYSNTSLYYNRL